MYNFHNLIIGDMNSRFNDKLVNIVKYRQKKGLITVQIRQKNPGYRQIPGGEGIP